MGMGLNNPLPASMESECRKAARILESFITPQALGADKIIPSSILQNAKGLAILTVIKGGFLASVRVGSGLVIARLADGTWSAPSAIGTAGAGFGGQIGAELTDFVFILNDSSAVKTFSQAGSITLGGNVSVAAGPVGRNAEASGAASLKSVSGIFSYSKTKGLFAGVSLEGSVIVERKDANKKLYNQEVTARQLLGGNIRPPPAADALIRVLESRAFNGGNNYNSDMYTDAPVYENERDTNAWSGGQGSTLGSDLNRDRRNSFGSGAPNRSTTWHDDVYDRDSYGTPRRSNTTATGSSSRNRTFDDNFDSYGNNSGRMFNSTYTDDVPTPKIKPARPTAPKPVFNKPNAASLGPNQAIALYTFEGDQAGDLSFKKGDIITITKRTESKNDWWTGTLNGKTGIFPSNYVDAR